jgi:hypothetical protein
VQIVDSHLHGLLQNRSSTLIKDLPILQSDVQVADKLKNLEWEMTEVDSEILAHDNLSQSFVQIVVLMTLFLLNQKVTSQFCAATVLDNRKVHKQPLVIPNMVRK